MRKPISPSQRFKVFERDWFCCQYCGRDPIKFDIVLEVDHIISVKDWWDNYEWNLVTSCFECNRGKSRKSVIVWSSIDVSQEKEKLKMAKERLRQIKKIKSIRSKISCVSGMIEEEKFWFIKDILSSCWDALKREMNMCIKWRYNKWTPLSLLEECLTITYRKFSEYKEFYIKDFVKYFYWVLRNKE